ncbi:MAG: metallophosphoesterase [Bacillota bacterium]|nr:metallophosphoesterase [Bacillota bacterium]
MIRIGVISDTHNCYEAAYEVLKRAPELNLLCHAGDMYHDGVKLGQLLGVEAKAVKGNCDYYTEGPEELVFEIGKKKILLTHGDQYRIKEGIDRIIYRAQELEAHIVIFGHTHQAVLFNEQGINFINPGSMINPRGSSNPSYAIIEIIDEEVTIEILEFALD